MIVTQEAEKLISLIKDVGNGVAHIMHPNEHPYYMVAFELTTWDNQTIDYLAFPVMPSEISVEDSSNTTIKKTLNGVVSTSLSGFTPRNISISGNFGRGFIFLLNNETISLKASRYSTRAGVYEMSDTAKPVKSNVFNTQIKEGYGCFKVLQSIIRKSNEMDETAPFKLYFYNMALNEHYLVKADKMRSFQNLDKNFNWQYNIQMTAIARAFDSDKQRVDSLNNLLTKTSIRKFWQTSYDLSLIHI